MMRTENTGLHTLHKGQHRELNREQVQLITNQRSSCRISEGSATAQLLTVELFKTIITPQANKFPGECGVEYF